MKTPEHWGWFNGLLVTVEEDGRVPLRSSVILDADDNGIVVSKENSAKIAAVPEMLAALKRILHIIDNYDGESLATLGSIADEAIGKAEGL